MKPSEIIYKLAEEEHERHPRVEDWVHCTIWAIIQYLDKQEELCANTKTLKTS